MSSSNVNPHDRYLRSNLMDVAMAKDYFVNTLPKEVLEIVDLDTLVPQPESLIDDKLSLRISDMLYKVTFKIEAQQTTGFLYLLIEHSSTSQPMLPLRMMEYMTRVLVKYVDQNEDTEILPPICPQIVYNGKYKYRHSLNFFDLFGDHKDLMQKIWNNPLSLLDLSQASDENLKKFDLFYLCSTLAKHIHDPDLLPLFERFVVSAFQHFEALGLVWPIRVTMSYVYKAGNVSDLQKLHDILFDSLQKDTQEEIMRIENELISKGQQIGQQIGWENSENYWKKEQKKETALRMLAKGATVEMIAEFLDITEDEVRSHMHII
jgi:predicted transposase/invertase (TIGR01784 family)